MTEDIADVRGSSPPAPIPPFRRMSPSNTNIQQCDLEHKRTGSRKLGLRSNKSAPTAARGGFQLQLVDAWKAQRKRGARSRQSNNTMEWQSWPVQLKAEAANVAEAGAKSDREKQMRQTDANPTDVFEVKAPRLSGINGRRALVPSRNSMSRKTSIVSDQRASLLPVSTAMVSDKKVKFNGLPRGHEPIFVMNCES